MTLDGLGEFEYLLTALWSGGKAVPASDGGRFDVLDPATGQGLTSVANGTVDDALAAVDAAHSAGATRGTAPCPRWAPRARRRRSGRPPHRASARRSCAAPSS